MIRKVTNIYDEHDVELLQKFNRIPDDPCHNCLSGSDGCCCGCDDSQKYNEAIKPYKDADIYENLRDLKRHDKLMKQISELKLEAQTIRSKYKDASTDIYSLFRF